jgi:myo-inositol 2-dehydrogenase / D-chiro-inositol 1-dehydrogenase
VTSDEPVRVALLGAGRMGRAHLAALAAARDAEAAAVVEPVETTRAQLQAEGFVTYEAVGELLDAGGFDAALIAAPTDLHLELVATLARAGTPILCEKPCGLRPEDTAEAARIAAEARVVLQIGYWRRFVPDLIALRERIAAGELGEPAQIWCWQWDERPPSPAFRARSGGILLDMGVHEFDQIRWLTGQEILDVSAVVATVVSEPAVAGDPESVAAVARLSGGAVATVSLGRRLASGEGCWVEVIGTEGHARAMFVWGEEGLRVIQRALVAQLDAFAAAVRGAEPQGATGEDALRAIETADRAAHSLGAAALQ